MGKPEAQIEIYLKKRVEEDLKGIAYKFTSPARRNVPDRVCAFPTGLVCFVECKAPGGELSKGQAKELQRLIDLSQPVMVVQSKANVDEFIDNVKTLIVKRRRV